MRAQEGRRFFPQLDITQNKYNIIMIDIVHCLILYFHLYERQFSKWLYYRITETNDLCASAVTVSHLDTKTVDTNTEMSWRFIQNTGSRQVMRNIHHVTT
jgi:bacteriorhodopsin